MTTTDTDGVPVIEPSGPLVGRRSTVPLLLLLCAVGVLAIAAGFYAWLHHTSSEASIPVAAPAAGIRPAPHSVGTALAAPKALTAPEAVVTSDTGRMPLAGIPPTTTKARKKITTESTAEPMRARTAFRLSNSAEPLALPPADNRVSQMRKTFEQNGWSVYWLDDKNEVTAWKSEGKTGYEIRLTPGARHATVLKTGGRNIILKQWTVSLASPPVMRGYHVYTNANTLLRGALTRIQ